jgi:thiol-disulfide isomerase/thioredoxin
VAALIATWPACSTDSPGTPPATANLGFTVKDMHNNDVNLETFKGRPLLLNFWATWCTPCKHEIPILVDLVEKYKDRGFMVLGISTDDRPDDTLRGFAAEYKINYPVLIGLGQDELQETYEAMFEIPVSWFIRADGTVMLKHRGIQTKAWFEQQVEHLIGTATPAGGLQ